MASQSPGSKQSQNNPACQPSRSSIQHNGTILERSSVPTLDQRPSPPPNQSHQAIPRRVSRSPSHSAALVNPPSRTQPSVGATPLASPATQDAISPSESQEIPPPIQNPA